MIPAVFKSALSSRYALGVLKRSAYIGAMALYALEVDQSFSGSAQDPLPFLPAGYT